MVKLLTIMKNVNIASKKMVEQLKKYYKSINFALNITAYS